MYRRILVLLTVAAILAPTAARAGTDLTLSETVSVGERVTGSDVAALTRSPYPGRTYVASRDCWRGWRGHEVYGKNRLGQEIWRFGSKLTDCVRDGKVVAKTWNTPYGWTAWFTVWNWDSSGTYIEQQSPQTLPRSYVYRQWRGHFHASVPIPTIGGLVSDMHPWVYIGGRGDGTWGTNGGKG
jgi:hypothetical protein